MGSDRIGVFILKASVPFLLPVLTHLVNYCLIHSVFLQCWKKANVILVPKSTALLDYKDLQPISILPTLLKVLEKAVENQIRAHLEKYEILAEKQSGFRAGYSCCTALLDIVDDVIKATDQNKLTLLILLDFSKTFDTINHNILLAFLHSTAFDISAITFFYKLFE